MCFCICVYLFSSFGVLLPVWYAQVFGSVGTTWMGVGVHNFSKNYLTIDANVFLINKFVKKKRSVFDIVFHLLCDLVTSTGKYSSSCPRSMVYSYNITSSGRTCHCLSTADISCHFTFPPIDGCVCAEGTFLDESGSCVPAKACPCYDKGSVIPPGQVVNNDGIVWYEQLLYQIFKLIQTFMFLNRLNVIAGLRQFDLCLTCLNSVV